MQVIFLHGFGENADVWSSFLPLLPTTDFNYISLDYSTISFCQTIEEYADWLHHEVGERKITRFVLIGHSMGGYIALAYAKKHADYLAGLGLFHSSALADSEEKKDARDKTVQFIQKHGTAEFIADFLPKMYEDSFRKRNFVFIQQHLKDNQTLPEEALITATKAMKVREDTTDVLKKLTIPTLMIIGKQDKFVAYDKALEQLALCQHPYVLILDNVAHAAMHEAPQAAAAVVTDFLKACK